MLRVAPVLLGAGVSLLFAACAEQSASPTPSGPLAITSVTPAAGAAAVETGATVTVVFNQAIDPATLTAATLQVRQGGSPLPATLSYDVATRTARAAAPLLPDSAYDVVVTTGVHSSAGSALSAPHLSSFTTRAWQAVTVDTAGGLYTSLAVDHSGRTHVSYWVQTTSALTYATCAGGCGAAAAWQSAVADPNGGGFTSLVADPNGRVHVSYYRFVSGTVMYATCAADCAAAANWQVPVGVDPVINQGQFTSLAVDATGRIHLTYRDVVNLDLKYATCATGCDMAAGWHIVTVDDLADVGRHTSVAVDAGGRVHASYYEATNYNLKYATCAAGCDDRAAWDTVTVDADGTLGDYTSLAVDAGGHVHVSYRDGANGDLKYATCAAGCALAGGWQTATVDTAGNVGMYTSLAVDARGRLHVSYYDATNGDLKYATCAAGCEAAGGWRAVTADSAGDVGPFSSLGVDASGRLHVAYEDVTNGALKYLE